MDLITRKPTFILYLPKMRDLVRFRRPKYVSQADELCCYQAQAQCIIQLYLWLLLNLLFTVIQTIPLRTISHDSMTSPKNDLRRSIPSLSIHPTTTTRYNVHFLFHTTFNHHNHNHIQVGQLDAKNNLKIFFWLYLWLFLG